MPYGMHMSRDGRGQKMQLHHALALRHWATLQIRVETAEEETRLAEVQPEVQQEVQQDVQIHPRGGFIAQATEYAALFIDISFIQRHTVVYVVVVDCKCRVARRSQSAAKAVARRRVLIHMLMTDAKAMGGKQISHTAKAQNVHVSRIIPPASVKHSSAKPVLERGRHMQQVPGRFGGAAIWIRVYDAAIDVISFSLCDATRPIVPEPCPRDEAKGSFIASKGCGKKSRGQDERESLHFGSSPLGLKPLPHPLDQASLARVRTSQWAAYLIDDVDFINI
ncbi:uncharacterized protein TRIVIDRAFT_203826 [Trichoderma virens Gv29-8]|uniref:Uncharacterized protein n=1 Tax=Hypocrea virens (strain Gv29-8 / FGSC 10586) TaxID=413071 RepID=G9N1V9_HYPVG|nr:uncharacterized protein TRIVIDRAFT_203826 [Trichoderma virens Gv29-8]EHK19076.1 hypothetical protein TRIVIDRAFT_203826 [Trichoderma virens Gv29-8]